MSTSDNIKTYGVVFPLQSSSASCHTCEQAIIKYTKAFLFHCIVYGYIIASCYALRSIKSQQQSSDTACETRTSKSQRIGIQISISNKPKSGIPTTHRTVTSQTHFPSQTYSLPCLMPHLFLHSALPMMAPVPTRGISRPTSCVLRSAWPKAAWMMSAGMFQSAGRMLSVPASSLLSALRSVAGSQSDGSLACV
jgi:hypothetical protein